MLTSSDLLTFFDVLATVPAAMGPWFFLLCFAVPFIFSRPFRLWNK